jgi:hypothetical protein
LVEPVADTAFAFNGSILDVQIQDVVAMLDESEATASTPSSEFKIDESTRPHSMSTTAESSSFDSAIGENSPMVLPFGVVVSTKKAIIYNPGGESVHTMLDGLKLKLAQEPSQEKKDEGNTRVSLTLDEFNHDMVRLKQPSLSVTLKVQDFGTLLSLQFVADEIKVASGYSIRDWKALVPRRLNMFRNRHVKKDEPIKLPYAHVGDLTVIVLVKSKLVGLKDTVLHIKQFDGKETTTSSDLVRYYSEGVISRVPGMVANAEVLGASVTDTVVGTYGSAFGGAALSQLGGALGGASIGGVMSVAAFDGVRNTVREGKKSRGVGETDKWELTDLARGLKYAAGRASRDGAAKRGKSEDEKADAIDWAVGASTDVGNYTKENKSRLGGAGAGAVGFAYGFAFGGPVGAIAGTIVASAATKATIDKVDAFATAKSKAKELTSNPEIMIDGNVKQIIRDLNAHSQKGKSGYLSHAHSPDTTIPLSGVLLKRRDFVKWDWRGHYFMLDNGVLKYFELSTAPPEGKEDEDGVLYIDSSKGPRKSLNISIYYVKADDDLSKPDQKLFVFSINSSEQKDPLWVLAAASEEIRETWISRMNKIHVHHHEEATLIETSVADATTKKDA